MKNRWTAYALAAIALAMTVALPVAAQTPLQATLIADGLDHPVGLVQDPSDSTVQVIIQLGGHLRVLQNGVLQPEDYLDLSGLIAHGAEQGVLGLAFAPDYGTSGRVFVYYVNVDGNTEVSRFTRSGSNPLQADPSTRFDFTWPDGNPFIIQPVGDHNGGTLAFGADGYLYLGLGDGGGDDDPYNNAQNPSTLLGKMLRLDVSVGDDDPKGYQVPPDNPFLGVEGFLGEIWAVGYRNPYRWSFDDPAKGGTGAMLVADVGQDAWEELDYEPRGASGRNYGWRVREGANDFITDPPELYDPLTDPIFDYSHDIGHCIIGGFVYHGSLLGDEYQGRYFFADFIDGRIWSLGLSIDPNTGEATTTDIWEHTSTVGPATHLPSGFGVDAAGEIYIVDFVNGQLFRLEPERPVNVLAQIDTPPSGPVSMPFHVTGWSLDTNAQGGSGVQTVAVWAFGSDGSATFVGNGYGVARPDIATLYGAQFLHSGYDVTVSGLAPGAYQLVAYGESALTGQYFPSTGVNIQVPDLALMYIDSPSDGAIGRGKIVVRGWALDLAASSGTGVDGVQVWANQPGSDPVFLGSANYGGPRPDVANAYGAQFVNSGWWYVAGNLSPGAWTLTAYAHSSISGLFSVSHQVSIQIRSGLLVQVDAPVNDSIVAPGSGVIAGWALDLNSVFNSGVSLLHVWAVSRTTGAASFLGAATLGVSRPDVANAFGPAFAHSGYSCPINLPPGDYDITLYAYVAGTAGFQPGATVHVIVGSR